MYVVYYHAASIFSNLLLALCKHKPQACGAGTSNLKLHFSTMVPAAFFFAGSPPPASPHRFGGGVRPEEESGLELSPTKINLIYAHLSPSPDMETAHSHKVVGSPQSRSEESLVLSDVGESQLIHNFLVGMKALLVLLTLCGFCGVYFLAKQRDQSPFPFTHEIGNTILHNVFLGFGFFFVADTVAYFIINDGKFAEEVEDDRSFPDDHQWQRGPSRNRLAPAFWRRALGALLLQSLQAGFIGVVSLGIMDSLWLNRLNIVFPFASLGIYTPASALRLGYKMLLDSLVYGTAANSWGIVARRVFFKGETLADALAVWDERILTVMWNEFSFWPLWNTLNFICIPEAFQVCFVGAGALMWNIYVSVMARRSLLPPSSPLPPHPYIPPAWCLPPLPSITPCEHLEHPPNVCNVSDITPISPS